MKNVGERLGELCLAGLLFVASVHAGILFTINDATLVASDPIQLGRLARNGVISDWSGSKAFPGVINPTTSYHYLTYFIPVLNAPYVQITVDDPQAAIFASAYEKTFNPLSFASNYLGDEGSSGNLFGVEPSFFQVVVPAFNNLVLVINDPAEASAGLGKPFSLVVEGFADANFTEPAPVAEPGVFCLTGSGLALAALACRLRRCFTG
jgi:hypothetical protein